MNTQPPEKRVFATDRTLEVHSIFLTIQGEGPFSGRRAIFIRLSGCNLQCPMCDTEYTDKRSTVDVDNIISRVKLLSEHFGMLVVITGGEPLRQNIEPLVETLLENDYVVQIETNGTLPAPRFHGSVTIVCSPKTPSINPTLLRKISAYKYVISAGDVGEDGLPNIVLGLGSRPVARPPANFKGPVYVQPADAGENALQTQLNITETVKSCIKHGYILQIQTHKVIGVE